MIVLLSQIWFVLAEALRAPLDAILGRARRRYTVSIDVDAPKPIIWALASAHSVRLEGTPPIEIVTEPDPARPGVYRGQLRIGELNLPMAYQVLEERPGEAMSLEILKAESAPECCPGDDYVCAFAVTGDDDTSAITLSYEVTHTRFSSRLLVPLAAVQNTRRLKRNAELRAGRPAQATRGDAVKNALVTGALTFASFFALFGTSIAAMLIVLILIHEAGHVIAMRWAGIPVKGIYFVPFFGGVAVSEERFRNEAERGLIAVMGPGFSLLTTATFAYLAMQSGDAMLRELAFASALLNGFNLLPILPLDGGHVAQALLSRFGEGTARTFHILALIAGGMLALALKFYVLLFALLLAAPALSARGNEAIRLPVLTWRQWWLLLVAYAATFAFYLDATIKLARG